MTHTTIGSLPHDDRRVRERRSLSGLPLWKASEGLRISWGGINGGVLLAVGLLILLAALGIAVGISAVNPGSTEASTFGTGAAIWSGVSLLAALFLGGYASTKLGATTDSTTGFFEGALVWVVSMLLMLYLAGSGIGMLASGAFQLVGGAGQAVGSMVSAGAGDLTSGDVDQIATRLENPETARQVATATGLPYEDVRSAFTTVAQEVRNARDDPAQAAAEVRRSVENLYAQARARGTIAERAEAMQPEASAAAWITFVALVLSLGAAIGGGMVGRRPEPVRVTASGATHPDSVSRS